MAEIVIKLDIPQKFKKEFEMALARVLKEMELKLKLFIAEEIISKSQFSERDADELSEKVKLSMHTALKKKGLV